MFSKVFSFGVTGLDGFCVTVEADISGGLPQISIVGLPDSAVKESTDRVRSALKNCGFTYPVSRVTINLAPAHLKKTGPVYDLPLLIAILTSSNQIPAPKDDMGFVGELGLDGNVRAINGVLPMAICAKENGIKHLFVPRENAPEAAVVNDINVYAVDSVKDVCNFLNGENELLPFPPTIFTAASENDYPDFSEVKGQFEAKRAFEIAAAGNHNIALIGAPGTGKSMLAKRLPGILPPLTEKQAIEISKVYSIIGMLKVDNGLVTTRPFRSPHHTVTPAGLSGGGTPPKPGEISLAHNGVLFLDELPEFHRETLDLLRQPLEDNTITISRANSKATYPCNIMLVCAMNPCPCGYFGHPTRSCTCSPHTIDRYLRRVSGPLLDRIDLHVEVMPVEYDDLQSNEYVESSADILKRVMKAREIQYARFKGTDITCNADISDKLLKEFCKTSSDAEILLKNAFENLGLSARGYGRILKVSRTIADLDNSEIIESHHVAEAIQYRNLDRKYWYNN